MKSWAWAVGYLSGLGYEPEAQEAERRWRRVMDRIQVTAAGRELRR